MQAEAASITNRVPVDASVSDTLGGRVTLDHASLPKLPMLKDGDNITSFFVRFERIADLLRINPNHYAVRLVTLLLGLAVDIYAALSPDITGDYSLLKKTLLAGYNKTPESYRFDIRQLKIGYQETYQQFSIQLGRNFDNWVQSRSLPKTYEDLSSFVIADQFISSLPPDLRLFIKEHNVSAINEMVSEEMKNRNWPFLIAF